MSGPTAPVPLRRGDRWPRAAHDPATRSGALRRTFRAMACDVAVALVEAGPHGPTALDRAAAVFADVEASCTRFDPGSPLMRANRAGERWEPVTPTCLAVLAAAADAHARTRGAFDPRVLRALESWGYDRTWASVADGAVVDDGGPGEGCAPPARRGPWRPGVDVDRCAVRIGPDPVDLGGIGKGFAVDRAARALAGAGRSALVEAGGDCALVGSGPDGTGWRVRVEDPRAADGTAAAPCAGGGPVAVLQVSDAAVATSSVRVRRWRAQRSGGREVHHLVDPRTGLPGGDGLLAVTVVAGDCVTAETWSKALFLAGADRIAGAAAREGLAALWVRADGVVRRSGALRPWLLWGPGVGEEAARAGRDRRAPEAGRSAGRMRTPSAGTTRPRGRRRGVRA